MELNDKFILSDKKSENHAFRVSLKSSGKIHTIKIFQHFLPQNELNFSYSISHERFEIRSHVYLYGREYLLNCKCLLQIIFAFYFKKCGHLFLKVENICNLEGRILKRDTAWEVYNSVSNVCKKVECHREMVYFYPPSAGSCFPNPQFLCSGGREQ